MLLENRKLIEAWKIASVDLEIETPYIFENNNKKIKHELLIRNFGNKKGT